MDDFLSRHVDETSNEEVLACLKNDVCIAEITGAAG